MGLFRHALILLATIAAAIHNQIQIAEAIDIGVNYGMLGDNLPAPTDVINLYKKYGIEKMRLFDPNPNALNAVRGSGIKVIVGVKNQDLPSLASNIDAVRSWVATNIEAYHDVTFTTISVGNEIIPGNLAQYILPVMQSLQTILNEKNLNGIKVSTAVASYTLGSSFPPSSGAFTAESSGTLSGILKFLSQQKSPLLINVYPYYAYAGDPANVHLDYAQFTATEPVVKDGGLDYYNLFDAVVDSFYSAMEKLGVSDVGVVVSESGWPSAGNGNFTTPQLAATYNTNFIKRIISRIGTPKRPNAAIDGYIFAMFNENQKASNWESHFGLFYPNMQPVYPVFSQLSNSN